MPDAVPDAVMSAPAHRRDVPPYGATYDGAIDLGALRRAHRSAYAARTTVVVDGNTAAAIPFLQWWRAPIVCGFPITPATKWLEHLAAQCASGKFDAEIDGRTVRTKRVKLLEAEHAAADYLVGVAGSCRSLIVGTATSSVGLDHSSCRSLIVGTATSSVGLDHMTETVRSIGASGLGNVILVDVCRATANYPLCIEGDPSDLLAHRDSGFIQVLCRGRQQIYDTLLQLPAIGMNPSVLTPTMPAYYGIKDSHRSGKLIVEPDDDVNAFLDAELERTVGAPLAEDFLDRAGAESVTPPGLLDGDTSMGNCVTSAWFQGFKVGQKRRMRRALALIPEVAARFEQRFGRRGIELFERHHMDDSPEVVLVAAGPDAGTALHLLPRLRDELRARIGLVVPRVISPFPTEALGAALAGARAIGVVNNAHHHGRGHLTLDVSDALAQRGSAPPIESFFCGLGGADVSPSTWSAIARITCDAAAAGRASRRWHLLHDGVELDVEEAD
jgi:pyruvate/2-oxoacid:ferredoxin oxidoreductase alpha subunit